MLKSLFVVEAQVSEVSAPLCESIVVCCNHSTFTGGDGLVGVKAESADKAKGATRCIKICLPVHFGRVFDNDKTVFLRDLFNTTHIGRKMVDVGNHYCLGLSGYGLFNFFWIYIPCHGL